MNRHDSFVDRDPFSEPKPNIPDTTETPVVTLAEHAIIKPGETLTPLQIWERIQEYHRNEEKARLDQQAKDFLASQAQTNGDIRDSWKKDLEQRCGQLRGHIKLVEEDVRKLKAHPALASSAFGFDRGEVIANITLAVRHLEDARMRLGKTIQAIDGGVSCYDR